MCSSYLESLWIMSIWYRKHSCCVSACCLCRDYRHIPRLDVYDRDILDESDYDALSPGARARVEADLRKRDRAEAIATGRLRRDLLYGMCLGFQEHYTTRVLE